MITADKATIRAHLEFLFGPDADRVGRIELDWVGPTNRLNQVARFGTIEGAVEAAAKHNTEGRPMYVGAGLRRPDMPAMAIDKHGQLRPLQSTANDVNLWRMLAGIGIGDELHGPRQASGPPRVDQLASHRRAQRQGMLLHVLIEKLHFPADGDISIDRHGDHDGHGKEQDEFGGQLHGRDNRRWSHGFSHPRSADERLARGDRGPLRARC